MASRIASVRLNAGSSRRERSRFTILSSAPTLPVWIRRLRAVRFPMGGRPVVAMFCVRERLRADSTSGTFLVSSTDAEGTQRTVTTEAERLGMIGRSTRGRPFKDYTGKSYRHWTVLRFVGRKGPKQLVAVYECRCDCGTIRDVMITSLTSKDGSRSCGCVDRGRKPTHGATIGRKPTPEFSVWDSMLDRCYSSTIPSYRRYGGRGIYVCDRWRSDFSAFRDDMGRDRR